MKFSRDTKRLRSIVRDRRGASGVEYGLILSLMFISLASAVATLGGSVQNHWDGIADRVSGV